MTHGSTFSGIGGPEVAASMLGWTNLFHCEINPFGRKILDYYFPNAESYEDITKTDFSKWRGRVDVLTGGFPCQPFSYAGKRKGSQDDRYLWPYMLRCIEQVRPTWFVGENVAGITTMVIPGEDVKVGCQGTLFGQVDFLERRERYVIEEICQQLEGVGYSVQPIIIPACAVGAPHRRDRVFFIANRHDSTDTECHRRREILQHIQPKLADGYEPICVSGEYDATNTANVQCNGRIADECRRRQTVSESRNDCRADHASDTRRTYVKAGYFRRETCNEMRKTSSRDWGDCSEILYPQNRWRTFPLVSPVYRGHDGLPFPVDDLTIPFSKWRKESLKAYGNAIVPQVMYEIFRAIEKVSQK